jgi:DeoR family fructose operon transcriptional repressor
VRASAKIAIGQKAAQLLPAKGSIFVDAGTTCLEVGRALLDRPGLQIVTNSIPLLELAPLARARLVSVGGEVRRMSLALTGGFNQGWLSVTRFDAAVIGAAGIEAESGAYTCEIHEAAVKADALRRATTRLLVADGAKWNRPTAIHFAPWSAFSYLVTNQTPPTDAQPSLAASAVAVHLAGDGR